MEKAAKCRSGTIASLLTNPLRVVLAASLLLGIFLGSLFFFPGEEHMVYGQDDDWDEIEERREEIEEMEARIKEMEAEVERQEERVQEVAAELEEAEKRLERAEEELEAVEERLEEQREVFGERVRSSYVNQGLSYVEMLFNVEHPGDLIMRLEYLARIFQHDVEMVEKIRESREEAEARAQEVEEERDRIAALHQEEKEAKENLQASRQEKEEELYRAKDILEERLAQIATRAEAPEVYGVIIDNRGDARPQHGLAQAQKVYEYEVESNVTRYLALYADFSQIDQVGPIRSARLHSAMMAMENDVMMVHAGASSDVHQQLDRLGVSTEDVLAREGDGSVWRDHSRSRPNNLYADLRELRLTTPPDKSEIRPVIPDQEGEEGTHLSFSYNNYTSVSYRYDEDQDVYRRYLNNQVHRDARGAVIQPRNVILQYVNFYIDHQGRPTADLVGQGRMEFYSHGQRFEGTWEKDSAGSPTRFYYEDGERIEIPYGKTWIQIIAQ